MPCTLSPNQCLPRNWHGTPLRRPWKSQKTLWSFKGPWEFLFKDFLKTLLTLAFVDLSSMSLLYCHLNGISNPVDRYEKRDLADGSARLYLTFFLQGSRRKGYGYLERVRPVGESEWKDAVLSIDVPSTGQRIVLVDETRQKSSGDRKGLLGGIKWRNSSSIFSR